MRTTFLQRTDAAPFYCPFSLPVLDLPPCLFAASRVRGRGVRTGMRGAQGGAGGRVEGGAAETSGLRNRRAVNMDVFSKTF